MLRTIEAPGIEIREVDKSTYSKSLTGTNVLVAGFANKGKDFTPMTMTSKNAWINYFGPPTNEAERYFYKASMEVINQGGKLYASKMMYDNASQGKFVCKKYTMSPHCVDLKADQEDAKQAKDDAELLVASTKSNLDKLSDNIDKLSGELDKAIVEKNDISAKSTLSASSALYNVNDNIDKYKSNLFEVSSYIIDNAKEDKVDAKLNSLSSDYMKSISSVLDNLPTAKFELSGWEIDSLSADISSYIDPASKFALNIQNNLSDFSDLTQETFNKCILSSTGLSGLVSSDLNSIDILTDNFLSVATANEKVNGLSSNFKSLSNEFDTANEKLKNAEIAYANAASEYDEHAKYWSALSVADSSIDNILKITSDSDVFALDADKADEYSTGEREVPQGEILFVDALRSAYDTTTFKGSDGMQKEYLGVVPVITTAANALYYQSILDLDDKKEDSDEQKAEKAKMREAYQALAAVESLTFDGEHEKGADEDVKKIKHDPQAMEDKELAMPLRSSNKNVLTMSDKATQLFPAVQYIDGDSLDRENLKKIGVVVFRAFTDPSEGNKVNFDILESFVGELDKNAKDPASGMSISIQEIVNNQSQYIEMYVGDVTEGYKKADILIAEDQKAGTLGFYSDMVKKTISVNDSINGSLRHIYEKCSDINERDIDLIVDAGISNIAQYITSMFGEKGEYNPEGKLPGGKTSPWNIKNKSDTQTWRSILMDQYDQFCKNVRRDCMFIADGLRPFCLQGTKKHIRPSKPGNTIDSIILPKLRYMTGINTSYGAGYCDWFQVMDEFSGKLFWCPPSIQALGVYIYTDLNANYWDAPAGLNRGMVTALDTAFSPTIKQAGEIYLKNWNYAINYPNEGIVLEGQKTFQVKPSAFDRVNVRRLFLRLERYVYKIARYYVYEGNTAYNRQRFVDQVTPYFEEVKQSGGMYDYKIICDESINTPEVIDNNELRVKIGIKPVKTIEFILIQFVCLRTGGSFDEM